MIPLAVEHVEQVDPITAAQRRLRWLPIASRTPREYRRLARWWELEAQRGYPSSADSRRYAANMREAAALAALFGSAPWLELQRRKRESASNAKRNQRWAHDVWFELERRARGVP